MYVTLDALMFSDNDEAETKLVKQVDEAYKGKTFAELVQKMIDGNADEYNEQAYNAQETQIANHVNNLLGQANSNPGSIQLYALSKDEPPQEINVGLNDKVSDYSDRILRVEAITIDGGGEKRYEKIDLTISDNTSGGSLYDIVMR